MITYRYIFQVRTQPKSSRIFILPVMNYFMIVTRGKKRPKKRELLFGFDWYLYLHSGMEFINYY